MHHTSFSNGGGGLFKGGSIFGSGSKTSTSSTRPTTSGGSHSNSNSTSGDPAFFTSSPSASAPFGRKGSFSAKSPKVYHRGRNTSIPANLSQPANPENRARSNSAHTRTAHYHGLSLTVPDYNRPVKPSSADSFNATAADALHSPGSDTNSIAPFESMLARPATSGASNGPPNFPPSQPPASPTMENIPFQHIQETASKRISTLDYLRKAHEGRVYWFNTLLFNKPDLQRMPYFDHRKIARRATNYLLLGLSLPTIIDLNGSNATEFLRTLNALLAEFESYQAIHPSDGSSSLSRGRFPQMFKRATGSGGKSRRTSSAAEIGLPMGNDSFDMKSNSQNGGGSGSGSATSFAVGEADLLPGEEYTYLLTPSLPFDPDFYETFATLCDILIDCYTKLMSLIPSPRECSPNVAELFTKADARVRKIIVQGVVKEFEDSSRTGVKQEVTSVGRVVLGGLI
ncbi:hypothetical protein HYALB_00006290 [Hymenoscyphus albidus]|uniref:Uncharacterized protein n=1 Tax=Hymenoscyphus albidus TaxID=595503 RepID=A0A9N9M3X2_9HELO|nr:hypothetical protein HYALB_00006290 [Hymenoscyphus albidus]